jgi:hypothetical protein
MAGRVVGQEADPAVAAHHVRDPGDQGIHGRIAAVGVEARDDFPRAQAGRRGVPEGEGGDLVGVDVFGALDHLGEGGDGVADLGIERGVGFEQKRQVGLDDERRQVAIHRSLPLFIGRSAISPVFRKPVQILSNRRVLKVGGMELMRRDGCLQQPRPRLLGRTEG